MSYSDNKDKGISYYTLDRIHKCNADYNIIYGSKRCGKTTAVLWHGIKDHINSGYKNQIVIIRRWKEDLKHTFDGIVYLGWIEEATQGKYNSVYYYSQMWCLCHRDNEGNITIQEDKPFAIGFNLEHMQYFDLQYYPNIKTILFDEFIATYYLRDEVNIFKNITHKIINNIAGVKIYMCGNAINKFCPYFNEMGLLGVINQKRGNIDIYTSKENRAFKAAVEYV